MSPTEIMNRQCELQERRLGMRSLDPAVIARHFANAAELRLRIAKDRLRLAPGPSGTKGARPPEPQ